MSIQALVQEDIFNYYYTYPHSDKQNNFPQQIIIIFFLSCTSLDAMSGNSKTRQT